MNSQSLIPIAAAAHGLAVLFLIIGLSTPSWKTDTVGPVTIEHGLWSSCLVDDTGMICGAVSDTEVEVIVTRAMVILAIIFGIAATFLSILWAVDIGFTKSHISKLLTITTAFAIAVFSMSGLIVYTTMDMDTATEQDNHLSWSFGLVVVGTVCGAFGGGCLIPPLLRN